MSSEKKPKAETLPVAEIKTQEVALLESNGSLHELIENGKKILYSFNESAPEVLQAIADVLNGKATGKKFPRAKYSTFGKYWQVAGVTLYPYPNSNGENQEQMFLIFHKMSGVKK